MAAFLDKLRELDLYDFFRRRARSFISRSLRNGRIETGWISKSGKVKADEFLLAPFKELRRRKTDNNLFVFIVLFPI